MKGIMIFAQAEAPAAADAALQASAETAAAETTATVEVPAGTDDAAAAAPAAPKQSGFGMLVPMLVLFGIFYFMMIRPQNRKEKERRKMIEELRAGAKVVCTSGIVGTIVEANERTFRIRTADSEVEVLRGAVQDVFTDKPAEQAAK